MDKEYIKFRLWQIIALNEALILSTRDREDRIRLRGRVQGLEQAVRMLEDWETLEEGGYGIPVQ